MTSQNLARDSVRWRTTLTAIGCTVLAMSAVAVSGRTADAAAPENATAVYVPGLGDFMTSSVQPRHIKLGLAGRAQNWALASYEMDELNESLEDVAHFHGTWDDIPVADLIASLMAAPLEATTKAIAAQSLPDFDAAYDQVTAGCNSCHQRTGHDYLVIQTPTQSPFPDQDFRPVK